jgi:hypothetical protein
VSRIVCDRTRKRWPFVGLELHTFCYPGKCPQPARLEETSNPRLASECIITEANKYFLFTFSWKSVRGATEFRILGYWCIGNCKTVFFPFQSYWKLFPLNLHGFVSKLKQYFLIIHANDLKPMLFRESVLMHHNPWSVRLGLLCSAVILKQVSHTGW